MYHWRSHATTWSQGCADANSLALAASFSLNVDLIAKLCYADATFYGLVAPVLIWDHLSSGQLDKSGSISSISEREALDRSGQK